MDKKKSHQELIESILGWIISGLIIEILDKFLKLLSKILGM